ncbi:hypothetical protein OG211_26250 [Streptomyces niveus]|uniref:hypothetical protein n=1 Tax=Streptomyces niveus TaxID=193462 RepID=UPI00386CA760|nr:hypothetical protein OG211_26250 [Streptomyces niveus]
MRRVRAWWGWRWRRRPPPSSRRPPPRRRRAAPGTTRPGGHEETRRALDAVGALMRGEWLKPRQLKAMKTTVFDSDYGLGIEKLTASCGKELWGHGGGWVGSLSYAATTEDGRHSFALNLNGDWDAGGVGAVLRAEFCDTP